SSRPVASADAEARAVGAARPPGGRGARSARHGSHPRGRGPHRAARVTPKLGAYAGLAALALLAALATRRPELAVVAAPFALAAGLGLLLARRPRIEVEVELGAERALEGDELELRVTLAADVGAERVEVLLQLPRRLVLLEGVNPVQLRLADGERRELVYR